VPLIKKDQKGKERNNNPTEIIFIERYQVNQNVSLEIL